MVKSLKGAPWLRLVYDSSELPVYSGEPQIDDKQYSFPFPEPDVIIIVDVSNVRYSSFRTVIHNIKPKWIFDIRANPRFDRIAGNRVTALRQFETMGSMYIDLFGIVGISNYKTAVYNPEFWTGVVEDFLRESTQKRGPYLALLDDNLMINSVSRHFASSVSHATGRSVALSKLDAEMFYD